MLNIDILLLVPPRFYLLPTQALLTISDDWTFVSENAAYSWKKIDNKAKSDLILSRSTWRSARVQGEGSPAPQQKHHCPRVNHLLI